MDVFGALADPVRRALLEELATGPARVVDLAARHPISRPAVSKHLRLLAQAGLVTVAEVGRERHYSLVPPGLLPVADLLARLTAPTPGRSAGPLTDRALGALETEVRRTVRDRRDRRTRGDCPREETA